MKKLRDIMRHGFLFTVQRGAMVAEAVRTMAANNVGIVAVLDDDRLIGVFSERDVVQKVLDRGLDPARTPVAEVMTARLDRKSTRLNSSHSQISYAVFCLKKKNRLQCRTYSCYSTRDQLRCRP